MIGHGRVQPLDRHTNGQGLNLNALLNMSSGWIVGLLVFQDTLAAEGVDEGGTTWRSRDTSVWRLICRLSLVGGRSFEMD